MSRKAGLNSWNFTAINSSSELISPFHKTDYLIGFSLNLNFPGNCKALKKISFSLLETFVKTKPITLGRNSRAKVNILLNWAVGFRERPPSPILVNYACLKLCPTHLLHWLVRKWTRNQMSHGPAKNISTNVVIYVSFTWTKSILDLCNSLVALSISQYESTLRANIISQNDNP